MVDVINRLNHFLKQIKAKQKAIENKMKSKMSNNK